MYNTEINVNPYDAAGYMKPVERKYLVVKLTNDKNGNDLDIYEQKLALGTPDLDEFVFPYDKSYINIFTEKPYHKDVPPRVFLNMKELPINRKTVPIFEFLAKLTKIISNTQDADYVIDKQFPFSPAGNLFIMGDTNISDLFRNQRAYIDKTLDIYNPKAARAISQLINDDIQERMIDYFL